jgi:hypothetical protein
VKRINLPQARKFLKAALNEKGRDFVYTTNNEEPCFYTPHSEYPSEDPRSFTGCVVGTALKLAGIDEQVLNRTNYVTNVTFDGVIISQPAREYFNIAQRIQDNGKTWGEAYDAAEESVQ